MAWSPPVLTQASGSGRSQNRNYFAHSPDTRQRSTVCASFRMARVWLAFSHSAKGEHRQAVEEFRKIEGVEDAPLLLSYLGNIYGAAGRREEARRVLGRLSELSKKTYVSPENMIVAHAGLGEKEEVFKWIERAFEAHDVVVAALKVAPAFDGLRDDPRYPGLLRRAGFTP